MGASHHSGTVNEVYPWLINMLNSSGAEVGPRGTVTKEWSPVVLELERPRERLVTSYGRPINVAFALAEVLWILEGRRDVAMLEFYNSRIKQFSDNGEVFNAPYGYRLRQAHGFDQIEDVIYTLSDDKNSRQGTLCIWHPNDRGWLVDPELRTLVQRRITKDRACNLVSHMMIRDGELKWLQLVRSNDAILGVPYNFMQFTHLQEYIAQRLGVPAGPFTYIADSMHIYVDGGYYPLSAVEDVEPFDIYQHLEPPELMDPSKVEAVAKIEESIRNNGNYIFGDLEGFWQDCCWIWAAHYSYRYHQDDKALDWLLMSNPVYGAAQMRFYWHNRWAAKLPDLRHIIFSKMPYPVAEWICSGR